MILGGFAGALVLLIFDALNWSFAACLQEKIFLRGTVTYRY
jgi:hypothetical protein